MKPIPAWLLILTGILVVMNLFVFGIFSLVILVPLRRLLIKNRNQQDEPDINRY